MKIPENVKLTSQKSSFRDEFCNTDSKQRLEQDLSIFSSSCTAQAFNLEPKFPEILIPNDFV